MFAVRVVWLIYLCFISKYNIWGKKCNFYVNIFVCVSSSDTLMLPPTYFYVYAWCITECVHKFKILHPTCGACLCFICAFLASMCATKLLLHSCFFSVSFASLSAAGSETDDYGKNWEENNACHLPLSLKTSRLSVNNFIFFDHLFYFSQINYYNYLKLFLNSSFWTDPRLCFLRFFFFFFFFFTVL